MPANSRSLVASVSTTYLQANHPRPGACDFTAVYWDAQAQDRSTSLEAQRAATLVVSDARR